VRGQRHTPAAFYPRERPGTHCTGGLVGPRAGLDVCEKPRPPTGIRSPDRSARSQSLYRLSYPAHTIILSFQINRHSEILRIFIRKVIRKSNCNILYYPLSLPLSWRRINEKTVLGPEVQRLPKAYSCLQTRPYSLLKAEGSRLLHSVSYHSY
jgi:hypothetical protein